CGIGRRGVDRCRETAEGFGLAAGHRAPTQPGDRRAPTSLGRAAALLLALGSFPMLHGVQVSWIAISSASRAPPRGRRGSTKVGIGASVNLLRPTRAFLVPAVIETSARQRYTPAAVSVEPALERAALRTAGAGPADCLSSQRAASPRWPAASNSWAARSNCAA